MALIRKITHIAQQHPATIVLPEAEDPRILQAAYQAQTLGTAKIILVGHPENIRQQAEKQQIPLESFSIEDVQHSEKRSALITDLVKKRAHRGMTKEKAAQALQTPLIFANMMVSSNYADGIVSGAVYSTADVVRAALQLIGTAPGTSLVSSFFLMLLDQPHHPCQRAVIFADCGLVVDPDEKELATIAIAAAHSAQALLGEPPRIAMLSFSTDGSAQHPKVTKVRQACKYIKEALPEAAIDNDVQFDAAIIPDIAVRKINEPHVKGESNIFIFPDLNSGNIGYKIAERLGGAKAIGPLLQGLAKPANDLSRGCDVEAIVNVIAITSLQARETQS